MCPAQAEAGCRIPLPIRCRPRFSAPKSAAGRVGRIVYKLLIYNQYPTLRGRCYEAKKCFFAADRGMPDVVSHGRPGSAAILPAPRRRCGALMARIPRCATALARRDFGSARRSAQANPFDRPHRVRGQRRDCDAVPGSAASAKRISPESECEPVFFMTAARWFSTVRWLMPRSAAMFLLG
jgi:hypothetical protein